MWMIDLRNSAFEKLKPDLALSLFRTKERGKGEGGKARLDRTAEEFAIWARAEKEEKAIFSFGPNANSARKKSCFFFPREEFHFLPLCVSVRVL